MANQKYNKSTNDNIINYDIENDYTLENNEFIYDNNNPISINVDTHDMIIEDNNFNGYYEDVPGNYNLEDISDNETLTKKINEIKKLKEKKRLIEPTEENYDLDYVETHNIKSKDVINGNSFV